MSKRRVKPGKSTADGIPIENAFALGADFVSRNYQVRVTTVGRVRNCDDQGSELLSLADLQLAQKIASAT